MTAPELIQLTGVTLNSIKGVHRRKNHVGFSQKEDLPQDVVDHFLQREGVHETDPARPVAAKPEPRKRTKPKRKPAKKTEPNQTEPKEQTEPEPVKEIEPEPTQTEPTEPFDLGNWLFFHPTAQFGFVVVLLCGGAYVFASLASELYMNNLSSVTFGLFFLIGFLVDASGIILSKTYTKKDKWDDANSVWFFLVVLFAVQLWIEGSYMFLESDFTWPRLAVVVVRPLGQLIYSSIYLNR